MGDVAKEEADLHGLEICLTGRKSAVVPGCSLPAKLSLMIAKFRYENAQEEEKVRLLEI